MGCSSRRTPPQDPRVRKQNKSRNLTPDWEFTIVSFFPSPTTSAVGPPPAYALPAVIGSVLLPRAMVNAQPGVGFAGSTPHALAWGGGSGFVAPVQVTSPGFSETRRGPHFHWERGHLSPLSQQMVPSYSNGPRPPRLFNPPPTPYFHQDSFSEQAVCTGKLCALVVCAGKLYAGKLCRLNRSLDGNTASMGGLGDGHGTPSSPRLPFRLFPRVSRKGLTPAFAQRMPYRTLREPGWSALSAWEPHKKTHNACRTASFAPRALEV